MYEQTSRESMRITIENRGEQIRKQLRERLEAAAELRCSEHGVPVTAVSIHGRENGWFDTIWTTCCEKLERQAAAIVKDRC